MGRQGGEKGRKGCRELWTGHRLQQGGPVTTKAKWSDFSSQEMKAMLERTTVLLKGLHACRGRSLTVCCAAGHPRISRLFLVMEAASNTEDMQIKLVALPGQVRAARCETSTWKSVGTVHVSAEVCAKEVLDSIFEVGGLLPKVPELFL